MKKKKWELAAMTAVTAFLMLGTKAEAMDDAYRMPQLSGVTKTWVYQGETSDQNWERMLAGSPLPESEVPFRGSSLPRSVSAAGLSPYLHHKTAVRTADI